MFGKTKTREKKKTLKHSRRLDRKNCLQQRVEKSLFDLATSFWNREIGPKGPQNATHRTFLSINKSLNSRYREQNSD